jgi:hypothetical protein
MMLFELAGPAPEIGNPVTGSNTKVPPVVAVR